MPHHRPCWFFGLVAVFAGLSLGTRSISKNGCLGDSLELYSNISFDNNFPLVSVYKNGVHNMLIATWTMHNSVINATFINGYGDKLSLDKKGNIWIYRLQISDEAKYNIKIVNANETTNGVVHLGVLVAPTANCKPRIKRVKDVLTVLVDANVCGRPAATVYWLNHSGTVHTETNAIELRPGKQAGTYYACIEGDALKCAGLSRFSDQCSFINIEEEKPTTGQKGAGIINNNTVQGQPLSGREGAEYSSKNTVEDINRSGITTIAVPLIIIASVLIIMSIVLVVRWTKKQKENPGGMSHGERSPFLPDPSGDTFTQLSINPAVQPPGNGDISTQLSNQHAAHPPENGDTSTELSNQHAALPQQDGDISTQLNNQHAAHPPESGDISTQLNNQHAAHPPESGNISTELNKQHAAHPPENGNISTQLCNQDAAHPPENDANSPASQEATLQE